jgi:uncharacterized protein DUF5317
MMLIVIAALCIVSVPLAGGHLGRLGELRLRWLWAAPVALALQVVIVTIAPIGDPTLHKLVHVASYVLIGVFLCANLHIAGARLIATGTVLNVIAIVANGGVMPMWTWAMRFADMVPHAGFNNSGPFAHPHLLWLGDVLPLPLPSPLHNVLSVGDLIIYAGMLVLLHRTCARNAPELTVLQPPSDLAPG